MLHSHLPWLAHAGSWPVGEEWLYQAWADSYLPVTDLLLRLAAEGRRNQVTLGVTPVLAAMLDDPVLPGRVPVLGGELADPGRGSGRRPRPERRGRGAPCAPDDAVGAETRWSAGGSPVFRALVDSGVAEVLGGPAAHPFLPLLDERLARGALEAGLEDTAVRLGHRPRGIWAPECAYRPGLEQVYADAGVTHFLVDGPTVDGETGTAYEVAGRDGTGSGVVAFPRDMEVSYRVWSPTSGYPGGPWYRDFHTFDHPSGLKPSRVTGHDVPPEHKEPYDPDAAAAALAADVDDFVDAVVAPVDAGTGARRAGRAWWSWPTTPNCSATGGTRDRPSSRRCCGACRSGACASRRSPGPAAISSPARGRCRRVRGGPARTGTSGPIRPTSPNRADRSPTGCSGWWRSASPTTGPPATPATTSCSGKPSSRCRATGPSSCRTAAALTTRTAGRTSTLRVSPSWRTGWRPRSRTGRLLRSRAADELAARLRGPDGPFGRLDARTVLGNVGHRRRRGVTPMPALRVLMLSWEYPPVVHGGLGRHVEALATALAGLGVRVTVVAPTPPADAGARLDGPVHGAAPRRR